jgi:tetratricopeptide (TPR) repeat protein
MMAGRVLVPAALSILFLLAAASASAQPGPPAGPRETLLMPFENVQSQVRLYWLAEGSALLLADFFEAFGGATVAREARVDAFERLQLPSAAALSHATVIKVAEFVGAAEVVVGTFDLTDDQLTVRARVIKLDEGRLLPEVVERGSLPDVFGIYERLARRVRDATTALPPAPAGTLLTSPPAFETYVKGLTAETPLMQRTYLEQAQKLAARDDRIRLALWQVHTDLGDHLKALDAADAIAGGRYARAARYLAALSNIDLKRYERAFEVLKTLASEDGSAVVLNALGVVQLLRGSTPESGKPAYYFNQAAQAETNDVDYFFNLGYAYWVDRDPPAAVYWLREAVRRNPADGDAHYVLGAALQQTGATAEAAREKELARRLSSSYAEWDKRAAAGGDSVPRGLQRLKDRLEPRSARVESILSASGQRDQAELSAFHLDAARRAFDRQDHSEAERELRRAVFLSPYLADAHVLLGRVYLRSGRTAEAVQEFKIALWSSESVEAHLALAEALGQQKDVAAALAEIDRALALDPSSEAAKALRERLQRAKM